MFDKKIKKEDLVEMRKRQDLIKQHLFIVQALTNENKKYVGNLLLQYGYGLNKNYNIDYKSGKVTAQKTKNLKKENDK